jgi:hypothetical protein
MKIIDETFLHFVVDIWGLAGPPAPPSCQALLSIIRERQTILSINYGN